MIAFIKRRWILLSCAVLLSAGTVVDFQISVGNGPSWIFGCTSGFVLIAHGFDTVSIYVRSFAPHRPMFVMTPEFDRFGGGWDLAIPVWMLVCVPIAWIAIRELRWRKKHLKVAEAQQA